MEGLESCDRECAEGRGLAAGKWEGVGRALTLTVEVHARHIMCEEIEERRKATNRTLVTPLRKHCRLHTPTQHALPSQHQ